MIEKKKALTRIPKNLVHEKTRLKQLHLAAVSSGNESEAEKIQDQLTQLEELAQGNRDKSISRENEMFLKVNERNRKLNVVEMREAERREAQERRKNGITPKIRNSSHGRSSFYRYGCHGSIFKAENDSKNFLRESCFVERRITCSVFWGCNADHGTY